MTAFTRWVAFAATLLVFAPVVYARAELGIGLVDVEFNEQTVIQFYESPRNRTPVRTIRFLDDKSINSWNIEGLKSVREWLAPESLWLDYDSFVLRCRSKRPGWLEVIVNNRTGKSYWVRFSPHLKFKTWEAFLKGMFSVTRSRRFPQKIRTRPVDGSREVKLLGRDCFEVVELLDDWIKVRPGERCEDSVRENDFRSGWIRWRHGGTLLIEYFITS